MNGLSIAAMLHVIQILALVFGGLWALGNIKSEMAVGLAVVQTEVKNLQTAVGKIETALEKKVDRQTREQSDGWRR